MNTHGVQTCHTTASHLIEHTHTGPSSTGTGAGGSPPPHMLSGSANDPTLVTLLTVPGPSHSYWSTTWEELRGVGREMCVHDGQQFVPITYTASAIPWGHGIVNPKGMLVTKNNMLFFCVIFCIQHKVCLQFICAIATRASCSTIVQQPTTAHALCRLTYWSPCITEGTVEWGGQVHVVKCGDVSLNRSRSHAHLDGKGRWHMYTMGGLRRQLHK